MSVIELVEKHVLGNGVSWVKRILLSIIILVVLYVTNSIFGFSYSYDNNRYDAISKLNSIIESPLLSPSEKSRLIREREEIINDESFIAQFLRFLQHPFKSGTIPQKQQTNTHSLDKNISFIDSNFGIFHFLSSNCIFIVLLLNFITEVNSDKSISRKVYVLFIIVFVVLIFALPFLALALAYLFKLSDNLDKIILAFAVQFLIIISSTLIGTLKTKKPKTLSNHN